MLLTRIKNIEFSSPIIAASGTFGYGDEVAKSVDLSKLGCIVTKSITLEERDGNPSSRIHGAGLGMINSIGLANVGVEKFCVKKIPILNLINTKFIISIAGSRVEDYAEVINQIEAADSRHVGYEINISCPNVKEGGIEFGSDKDIAYNLTKNLRSITDKLLIIKLSPNVTSISNIALAVEEGGADAITAVNTFVGLGINYKTGKMLLSTKFGGFSGAPIKPLALAKVHEIYNKVKIPIIGVGGIYSFKDVLEFIRVGSSMVQIGTLNYRNPSIIAKFNKELEGFLKDRGIKSIGELVGDFCEH